MRRLLCYASGAFRGVYYAGVMQALTEAGLEFSDAVGVSVGANAAAWQAAGQSREVLKAWDALCDYEFAPHPFLSRGRRRHLDWLLEHATLPHLDTAALRRSAMRVHIAVSRVKPPHAWLGGIYAREFVTIDAGTSDDEIRRAIRASSHMPFVNGLFKALRLGSHYYQDGGLTGRIPFDCLPLNEFDEVWCAVASENSLAELQAFDASPYEATRFYFIRPSTMLDLDRTEIDQRKFHEVARLGYSDARRRIAAYCADMAATGFISE